MENMDDLTKGFIHEDFVIVMDGSNDFLSQNSVPSFSKICSKLMQCTNANVLFTSVLYSTNAEKNMRVLKYNKRLDDFLCRFNRLVEGRIEYIETNNKRHRLPKTTLLYNQLTRAIFEKKKNEKLKIRKDIQ